MFNQLKSLFGVSEKQQKEEPIALDKNIAAAALMVHIMAVDGKVTPDEELRLREILAEHYAISAENAAVLETNARQAQSEAIDLYRFTSLIKSQMAETERLALIEDLWEMVYADGKVHEFEDNTVWRTAELLGILSDQRMALKKRVLERRSK